MIYKGLLNKKVLEQYLNGDEILTAGKKAEACPIDLAPSESKMTYVKDVAPILKSRCLSCHHPQGAAPWAMSDYEKVKGWTPMIKEVLLLKRMPPWLVDPRYDHFKTNLRLETGEAKKILNWIDQGSPRGEGIDPLKGLSDITQSDWSLGKPDLIIPLGKIKIPPRGKIPYFDLRISNPLKEPRWIRAVQFKPGNSRVLHHASVMYGSIIQDNDSDRLVSSLDSRPMTQFYSLASYVPGISHWEYPQKSGKLLKPHQEFYFELHYVPTGKDETDTPELGIYFHKNKPSRIFHVEHSSKLNFTIPSNESDYKLRGEDLLIHKDIDLHTLTCHMHYRGKSMRISAKYPNGTSEILLSVPRYNFNWQHRYILKEPKFIPKGSIIFAQAAFDNSKMNPFNPDPSKEVSQGRDTDNEMLYFVIGFTEKDIQK